MAKQSGQKLKLILLKDYLLKNTDENHFVTVKQIISYLESCGVSAERKSVYDDIELLSAYGLDIISEKKDRTVGYKVVSRDFEISELKLLVDAVQSSKFITERKSNELIKKIEGLCSRFEAYELDRQLTVIGRIKSMNESIYYNVDKIHHSIKNNSRISFLYFDYNIKKEKVFRHNGEEYDVSPFTLTWDDENYYLVGYDTKSKQIRHYRVDKMANLNDIESSRRYGKELFDKMNVEKYSQKVFSMFGGETEKVTLEFSQRLCGVVLDRFGKDIFLSESKTKNGYFTVQTDIVVSPMFYGWLFSFGKDAKILHPQSVKDGFNEYLKEVFENTVE